MRDFSQRMDTPHHPSGFDYFMPYAFVYGNLKATRAIILLPGFLEVPWSDSIENMTKDVRQDWCIVIPNVHRHVEVRLGEDRRKVSWREIGIGDLSYPHEKIANSLHQVMEQTFSEIVIVARGIGAYYLDSFLFTEFANRFYADLQARLVGVITMDMGDRIVAAEILQELDELQGKYPRFYYQQRLGLVPKEGVPLLFTAWEPEPEALVEYFLSAHVDRELHATLSELVPGVKGGHVDEKLFGSEAALQSWEHFLQTVVSERGLPPIR